ncbi:hypothetical protein Q5752_006652 [Cryptotrichosporon argae]
MWVDALDRPGPSRRQGAYVPRRPVRLARRQDGVATGAGTGLDASSTSAASTSSAIFGGTNATVLTAAPATPSAPAYTSSSTSALFVGPSTNASTSLVANHTSTWTSSMRSTLRSSTSRTSVSEPWSFTPKASTTTSTGAAVQSTYVPGVVFNLSLAVPSNDEAVYALPVAFGHVGVESDIALPPRDWKRASDWDGTDYQTFNLQVDLGSSDLWVATDLCQTSACTSAPALINVTASVDSGSSANLTFQSGSASGEIYWEEVQVGTFGIGYQAFVAADMVVDENLGGGNYSGVLGLALPQNSVIFAEIGGTTGSSPDGATFLDNLYGSGNSAPTDRVFALSLERYQDVRTASTLGIGTTDDRFCAPPCDPDYISIVADPSLGVTGFLYWRVPIDSVEVTTWGDAQAGTGANTTTVTLGPSKVDAAKNTPLAVLDSGGVAILVGYKPYVDAIYGAYGISASSDGYYRMPCTTQLAITFTIGGVAFPVHPLDMTWSDSSTTSSSQQTCVGALQYSSTLGSSGDFILGSAFLKNAYSIFSYPNTNKTTQATWQPQVALLPLTNASVASQDFYAVRSLGQSLSSVSSKQQTVASSSSSGGTSSGSSSGGVLSSSHPVARTAIIAACSVIGFFILAAAAFACWWFYFRRRLGATGVVTYPQPDRDRDSKAGSTAAFADGTSDYSSRRSQKHERTKRQKSIMEGFSDYEDSWAGGTECADSVRMAYLPTFNEDDGEVDARAGAGAGVGGGGGAGRGRRESSTGAHSWASRQSRASSSSAYALGPRGSRPSEAEGPAAELDSARPKSQYADAPAATSPARSPTTPAREVDPFVTPQPTPLSPFGPDSPGPQLGPGAGVGSAGSATSPTLRLIDLSSPARAPFVPAQPRTPGALTPGTPGRHAHAHAQRYDMAGPFLSASRASRAGELDMGDYFSIGRES